MCLRRLPEDGQQLWQSINQEIKSSVQQFSVEFYVCNVVAGKICNIKL
jgi:hypothetical protein